jgi:predicted TIM-barrel fold metal-dependent hydrolase
MDLHRVAMDYPNLNFVIPHFGAGYFREALMLGDLAPNVHMDTSGSNSWIKYSLPDITLKDVFRKALEVYGPNRLLFGSDSSFFPRGWNRAVFDTQVSALQELNVEEETARLIFAGNLRRLLDPT